jgi:hypothetical protein
VPRSSVLSWSWLAGPPRSCFRYACVLIDYRNYGLELTLQPHYSAYVRRSIPGSQRNRPAREPPKMQSPGPTPLVVLAAICPRVDDLQVHAPVATPALPSAPLIPTSLRRSSRSEMMRGRVDRSHPAWSLLVVPRRGRMLARTNHLQMSRRLGRRWLRRRETN